MCRDKMLMDCGYFIWDTDGLRHIPPKKQEEATDEVDDQEEKPEESDEENA